MFKVVPDQLRISDGWVRCGHCSEVFDARGHLQTLGLPDVPAAPSQGMPASDQVVRATDSVGQAAMQAPLGDLPGAVASGPASSSTEARQAPEALAPVSSGPMLVNPESPVLPRQDEAGPLDAMFRSSQEWPGRALVHEASTESVTDSVMDDDVSFVREARRKAFWNRPLVRTTLVVFALLLTCVLTLQVAVHERDRLAVLEPQFKPWLARLCAPLGCTVEVPRQIDSVVIDSATFNKVRGDVFRLSFTIRNASSLEVATPAVELTLTDPQDQTVVRRVLHPAAIGASLVLAPKGEWNAVVNLSVDADGGSSRVSGYRLLAFYL